MTTMTETQEQVERELLLMDSEGNSLESIVSPPEAELAMQGEILKTEKGENGRTYYEIFAIEHNEETVIARCRPITPRYLNAIILPAILLATWFGIQYAFSLLGIGG